MTDVFIQLQVGCKPAIGEYTGMYSAGDMPDLPGHTPHRCQPHSTMKAPVAKSSGEIELSTTVDRSTAQVKGCLMERWKEGLLGHV